MPTLIGRLPGPLSVALGLLLTCAAAPAAAGTVVEYVNTDDFPSAPGGHYFYSSDPPEQAALDAGSAGRFRRTGLVFYTGGDTSV